MWRHDKVPVSGPLAPAVIHGRSAGHTPTTPLVRSIHLASCHTAKDSSACSHLFRGGWRTSVTRIQPEEYISTMPTYTGCPLFQRVPEDKTGVLSNCLNSAVSDGRRPRDSVRLLFTLLDLDSPAPGIQPAGYPSGVTDAPASLPHRVFERFINIDPVPIFPLIWGFSQRSPKTVSGCRSCARILWRELSTARSIPPRQFHARRM